MSMRRRDLLCAMTAMPLQADEAFRPRPLGRSGLVVSGLALGCEELAEPAIVRRAVELGVNHLFSFNSWEAIGGAARGLRDKLVLSVGSKSDTRPAMEADIERALRELRTDHIDLWYVASRLRPAQISDEMLEAFRVAKQAGKIRAAAVTTHRFRDILPRLMEVGEIQAVMIACNFAIWNNAWTLIGEVLEKDSRAADVRRARAAGIGIVAMKPMLGGLKFRPEERKGWVESLDSEEKRQRALASALKWVLRNPDIDTALVHTPTLEILERNARTARQAFTEEDRAVLAAELERISPYYCRMCNACAGTCRSGLPVTDLQRFLLYAEGYGDRAKARAHFARLPERLQRIGCADCGACTVRCPNGVDVQQQLVRAAHVLTRSG